MRTREGGHKEEEEEEEEEEEGASDRKPAARLSSLLLGPCMPCGNSQSPSPPPTPSSLLPGVDKLNDIAPPSLAHPLTPLVAVFGWIRKQEREKKAARIFP